MRKLVILGSTGSIGVNALNVVRHLKDKFNVIGLSAYSNVRLLKEQINEFKPEFVCVGDEKRAEELHRYCGKKVKIFYGNEGLKALASLKPADIVLIAVVGAAGLYPLISAIESGKRIALANKESLVIAGDVITKLFKKHTSAEIIPVDSEHSAIFQCIKNESHRDISRLFITGSGGPFFRKKISPDKITPVQALAHPSWSMGKKITIDSATMMNKGFEVIEAHHLFGIPFDRIKLVIHPQSIVHSMVEFCDGSVLGLLSVPDMRLAIQYGLTYPERYPTKIKLLDLTKINKLEFYQPDYKKFPCLQLALESARIGGTMPAVLNAVNEVAVHNFLKNKIKFSIIPKVIEKIMKTHKVIKNPVPGEIFEIDTWARRKAEELVC